MLFFMTCDKSIATAIFHFFHDLPVFTYMWKKLKYFFYFYPDGSDFTRTNYYDEQMTTTVYSATAQKEQQTGRRRWIWSGESDNSEEPNYGNWAYDHDDDTDTSYEIAYSMWYDTHAHREWHDVDGDDYYVDDHDDHDDNDTVQQSQAHTRVPFMNLTKEQRDAKSAEFKFGLCSNCDAGLDDKSEFVCEPRGGPTGSFVITCNACYAYHQQVAFNRVDYGSNGGCN